MDTNTAARSRDQTKNPKAKSPRSIELPNPIQLLAPAFESYITIHGVDAARTYNYAAKGFFGYSAVRHTRHRPKCAAGESWLYVALPSGATPATITDADKLYVGAQTSDRMFRGDDCEMENFHHNQMRCDGKQDGLVPYLRATGRGVEIFRASAASLLRVIRSEPSARWLERLSDHRHFGELVESLVLHLEPPVQAWKWNKKGPNKKHLCALRDAHLAGAT